MLVSAIVVLAGCASPRLVDPGAQTWSGRLTCTGLTTAECNAGEHAVLGALGGSDAATRSAVAIEVSPGAACPTGLSDCSYALLPGQRLLGHAILDLGAAQVGYTNIRVASDGQVTADPIGIVVSPSS